MTYLRSSPPWRLRAATVAAVISMCLASLVVVQSSTSESGADANGLSSYQINGRPYGVRTTVHVVSFDQSQYSLKIGLAKRAVDSGLQTPSAMCKATTGCVAAVNGDFFGGLDHGRELGDNVGGIVQNCVLVHSPEEAQQQVDLNNGSVSSHLNWRSVLNINGTNLPITSINQQRPLHYAHVLFPYTGTLLYTHDFGQTVPTTARRMTYEFAIVSSTATPTTTTTTTSTTSTSTTSTTTTTSPTSTSTTSTTLPPTIPHATTINSTAVLTFLGVTLDAVRVVPGQVDISAVPTKMLATMQIGSTVTLTTSSTAGCDDIGGHPILLDGGVTEPLNPADTFLFRPYARTALGWTASGTTILMTVNGKDDAAGATMHQLVRLLKSVGVVTAINLDGGGSTTLYARGRVMSTPAYGGERHVATSVLVVRNS